ncbi:hypothetical protein JXR93_14445 [bacterium]|nr:hypothetical protein [bacterium]
MKKLTVFLSLFISIVAFSETYTIYVAEKGTPAAEQSSSLANDKTVFSENKIFKAFDRASEILSQKKSDTVLIKIAAGSYYGKGKTGTWSFPDTQNPQGVLKVLGGYDSTFKKRAPFDTHSILVISENRSDSVITFEGKKHALKELQLSGLTIDVAPGNKYDAKTHSLLKGTSCTSPILYFGYLETQKLIISDNIFMNSAHQVSTPLIRATNKDSVVELRNNLIFNNVYPWKADSARFRNTPKEYIIKNNSFLMNWPYNPDPTSGTVATVEVNSKDGCEKIVFEKNIFAFNYGGAIMPLYEEKRMPKMEFKSNLFYRNGALFKVKSADDGALVGKFNGSATYVTYNMSDAEDDLSYKFEKNQSFDPKFEFVAPELLAADSSSVKAQNTKANTVRSILGQNLQGGSVDIGNFAYKIPFDKDNIPFPKEEKAKVFGVQKSLVEQF